LQVVAGNGIDVATNDLLRTVSVAAGTTNQWKIDATNAAAGRTIYGSNVVGSVNLSDYVSGTLTNNTTGQADTALQAVNTSNVDAALTNQWKIDATNAAAGRTIYGSNIVGSVHLSDYVDGTLTNNTTAKPTQPCKR